MGNPYFFIHFFCFIIKGNKKAVVRIKQVLHFEGFYYIFSRQARILYQNKSKSCL
jgi:hypothetical protein